MAANTHPISDAARVEHKVQYRAINTAKAVCSGRAIVTKTMD